MNNTKELKQIIADAPDGATHYSWNTYCKAKKDFFYDWDGETWCAYFVPDGDMRSLADIRTIIGQAEENQALKERIAELERKSLELTALCCLICDLNECEQESEDFENIASELIDRALTVLGRTDT